MNSVQLIGRFARDPEVRYTTTDMAVARFTIACDRRAKDQDADFIPCRAFGKTAEFIGKYFKKGQRVGMTGHIQTGSYTNKDNQKVYTVEVIADTVEFVESKKAPNGKSGSNDFMNIPDGAEDGTPFD